MAERRNEGTLLCFVCRLRLNHEVGSCNIRIQLAVERRSFAIRENAFRLLVYMPKLKEGDTTPDPQTRCNGFVEGMAYKRENWAPVRNEVRFREDRSEGGEGKSRGVATGFSGSLLFYIRTRCMMLSARFERNQTSARERMPCH